MADAKPIDDAPPDFSKMTPAQIRLWKRRQKMLKSGEKRMAMVSGSHRSVETKGTEVTKAVESEVEASTTAQPSASGGKEGEDIVEQPPAKAAAEGERPEENVVEKDGGVEKAAWEKRWERAAEVAAKEETTAMPDIPSFTLPEEGETPVGLRQRKEEESRSKEDQQTGKEEDKGMKNLRMQLAKNRNQQILSAVRTGLVVLMAVALALWHVSHAPFLQTGLVEGQPLLSESNLFHDNEEGEVVVELADEEADDEKVETLPSLEIFSVEPPMDGWLSVPVSLLLLHVILHQLFTIIFPKDAPSLVNPSSGISAMVEGSLAASPAKNLLLIPKLLAAVIEDTTLFMFVFTLTAAASSLVE